MNNNAQNNTDQLLDPKELAAAFEHTMNFVKGDTEALPDMMAHTGRLLLRLSSRLSTTQMVLLVGALTLGAIFVAKRVEDAMDEAFDDDDDDNKRGSQAKALSSGSGGGTASSGNKQAGSAGASSSDQKTTGSKSSAGAAK